MSNLRRGGWATIILRGRVVSCIGQERLFALFWLGRQSLGIRSPPWAGQVNLAFATEELRDRCEIQTEGERAYGTVVAEQIRERLADLIDADNVFELPTGNPREVLEGNGSYYEIELPENFRIVIRAHHKRLPRMQQTGGIDWSKVTRVTVNIIDPREAGHVK